MTINRTTLLDLPLPVTGTESGTWGDTTNNGLTQYMDIAIAGMSNLTSANFTAGAVTIETTEGTSSATNIVATSAQYAGFRVTSLAQNSTITVGNTGTSPARSYRLINADATYSLTFKATGQTGVTLLPGQSAVVAFNGTDYVIVGMVGAGTATDNAVVRFDGTTGKLVQNSVVTIADSTGDVAGVGALTMGGNLTLSGGTANGVLYLNGSKGATSGSALTFDGTNFATTGTITSGGSYNFNTTAGRDILWGTGSYTYITGNPGTGVMAFGIANAELMRLTSTGLGIGTSSPGAKLDNRGELRTGQYQNDPVLRIVSQNTAGPASTALGSLIFNVNANNIVGLTSERAAGIQVVSGSDERLTNLDFYTATVGGGSSKMRLDSSGNLGLGVTPSAWYVASANARTLQINNAGFYADTGNSVFISSNYLFNTSGSELFIGNGYANRFLINSGEFRWLTSTTNNSSGANQPATMTQAMTLDASGNLLVGDTSTNDNATLVVRRAGATVGATTYTLGWFQNATGYENGLAIKATDNAVTIAADFAGNAGGAAALIFATNSTTTANNATERARITSGGYFKASNNGTYASSAGSLHELKGNPDDNVLRVENYQATLTGAIAGVRIIYSAATPNTTTRSFIYCDDSTTLRAEIRSNGGIANYSANDVNLSDRREKTNFAPAKSYLDTICAIPVQTFNYIDQSEDDPGLTLGVVAQDVQAVAPELVMESNWGTAEDPKMRLSIYQTDLQYALMKCIQEQQALITSLTARVALLEGN